MKLPAKCDNAVKRQSAYRAVLLVYFIQQDHDFLGQAQRSGIAGRRRAIREPHKAEETQESGESQPHVV